MNATVEMMYATSI